MLNISRCSAGSAAHSHSRQKTTRSRPRGGGRDSSPCGSSRPSGMRLRVHLPAPTRRIGNGAPCCGLDDLFGLPVGHLPRGCADADAHTAHFLVATSRSSYAGNVIWFPLPLRQDSNCAVSASVSMLPGAPMATICVRGARPFHSSSRATSVRRPAILGTGAIAFVPRSLDSRPEACGGPGRP